METVIQQDYEEERKIHISDKYTQLQNVMLLVTEIPELLQRNAKLTVSELSFGPQLEMEEPTAVGI